MPLVEVSPIIPEPICPTSYTLVHPEALEEYVASTILYGCATSRLRGMLTADSASEMMMVTFVDFRELTRLAGVESKSTVRRWYDQGDLPEPDRRTGGWNKLEWEWPGTIREALAEKTNRPLPIHLPGSYEKYLAETRGNR